MRRTAAILGAVALAAAALAAAAPSADAHATLESTSPDRGAELAKPAAEVTFTFSEPVELSFGSLRVFDSAGEEVQSGDPTHPGGRDEAISVGLPSDLPDGSYTATYRVISADSHPVSGGFVFSVGPGSAAPAASVSELLDSEGSGAVTDVAFAAARSVSYAAIALAVGGVLFILLVWLPGVAIAGRSGQGWSDAGDRFAAAARALLAAAVAAGVAGTVAGIVLQGAVASGGTFWDALDSEVIGDVLGTRFGTVWAIRLGIWVALAALLAVSWRKGPLRRPPLQLLVAGGALLLALAATPAFAGHASTQGDEWALVPSTVLHVLSMSAWTGGLAFLIAALPAATRALEPASRTRLLAACLTRFSAIALACVAVLLATGTLQSILELDSIGALFDTTFGRLILAKAALLAVLIGLGAYNRRRSVPQMRELADGGSAPGRAGLVLRRVLRTEVALVGAAIVLTSFLVAQTPTSAETGPAAGSTELGDARLDYTVDPAAPGANEIHLYLTDAETGTPFEVKSAEAYASIEDKDIGPIEIPLELTGPGHYTSPAAPLGVAGEWTIELDALVSKFDQLSGSFEVDVR